MLFHLIEALTNGTNEEFADRNRLLHLFQLAIQFEHQEINVDLTPHTLPNMDQIMGGLLSSPTFTKENLNLCILDFWRPTSTGGQN